MLVGEKGTLLQSAQMAALEAYTGVELHYQEYVRLLCMCLPAERVEVGGGCSGSRGMAGPQRKEREQRGRKIGVGK